MTQIATSITPNQILPPYENSFRMALQTACVPVDEARQGDVIAFVMNNKPRKNSIGPSITFNKLAIFSGNSLDIILRREAVTSMPHSHADQSTSGLLIRPLPFEIANAIEGDEVRRRRTFGGRPEFTSFITQHGAISIVGDLGSSGETRAFSTGLLTHQNCVDSVFQIYLPKPRSSHEEIENAARFESIKPLAKAVIESFGEPYKDLLQLL